MKRYKIYAIKFRGKVIYVGQTGDSVDARFWKHLHAALHPGVDGSRIPKLFAHIRAHGGEGYTFEMLEVVKSDRSERERFWIKKFKTQRQCNTTAGGITAKGAGHYASRRVCWIATGKIFESMADAAEAANVSVATVCLHANGKRKNQAFKFAGKADR